MRQRERETERQRHRQREKQAPCREPDTGLDPGTPGSHPGPKAGDQPLSHPGIPRHGTFKGLSHNEIMETFVRVSCKYGFIFCISYI